MLCLSTTEKNQNVFQTTDYQSQSRKLQSLDQSSLLQLFHQLLRAQIKGINIMSTHDQSQGPTCNVENGCRGTHTVIAIKLPPNFPGASFILKNS